MRACVDRHIGYASAHSDRRCSVVSARRLRLSLNHSEITSLSGTAVDKFVYTFFPLFEWEFHYNSQLFLRTFGFPNNIIYYSSETFFCVCSCVQCYVRLFHVMYSVVVIPVWYCSYVWRIICGYRPVPYLELLCTNCPFFVLRNDASSNGQLVAFKPENLSVLLVPPRVVYHCR